MARGCYDTFEGVLGAVRAVPGLSHVKPCEVLGEIYRDRWVKPNKRDDLINRVLERSPRSEGLQLFCDEYVSPDGKLGCMSKRAGWKPEASYNKTLILCTLAARFRVKCKICERLHDDRKIEGKFDAYREHDDTRIYFSGIAPVCSDCARRRFPFDDPEEECRAITAITYAVDHLVKQTKKREVKKREWDELYSRFTNSPWI